MVCPGAVQASCGDWLADASPVKHRGATLATRTPLAETIGPQGVFVGRSWSIRSDAERMSHMMASPGPQRPCRGPFCGGSQPPHLPLPFPPSVRPVKWEIGHVSHSPALSEGATVAWRPDGESLRLLAGFPNRLERPPE